MLHVPGIFGARDDLVIVCPNQILLCVKTQLLSPVLTSLLRILHGRKIVARGKANNRV